MGCIAFSESISCCPIPWRVKPWFRLFLRKSWKYSYPGFQTSDSRSCATASPLPAPAMAKMGLNPKGQGAPVVPVQVKALHHTSILKGKCSLSLFKRSGWAAKPACRTVKKNSPFAGLGKWLEERLQRAAQIGNVGEMVLTTSAQHAWPLYSLWLLNFPDWHDSSPFFHSIFCVSCRTVLLPGQNTHPLGPGHASLQLSSAYTGTARFLPQSSHPDYKSSLSHVFAVTAVYGFYFSFCGKNIKLFFHFLNFLS